MAFKKHMIRITYSDGGFSTLCGIDESCSEEFYDDPNVLVAYGDKENTTCKRCLLAWAKEEEWIENEIKDNEK